MSVLVGSTALPEQAVEGKSFILAPPGQAFEVQLRNRSQADYFVTLFVGGNAAEPGYVKKLRGKDSTLFRGFLCRGSVHEFVFEKTPVDPAATSSATAPSTHHSLGEVRAVIYATRRVRVAESSSDEEAGHLNTSHIGVVALPEKAAVKVHARLRFLLIPPSPCTWHATSLNMYNLSRCRTLVSKLVLDLALSV